MHSSRRTTRWEVDGKGISAFSSRAFRYLRALC